VNCLTLKGGEESNKCQYKNWKSDSHEKNKSCSFADGEETQGHFGIGDGEDTQEHFGIGDGEETEGHCYREWRRDRKTDRQTNTSL
jgi:hypothetical protein